MRRLLLLLCISLFTSGLIHGNDPAHALHLKSGTIYPENNINKFISEDITPQEIVDGYYFRIIQFTSIPDENLQREIARSGIILNMYLPYLAYNCAIPVNFDRNKLPGFHANSAVEWKNNYKIQSNLNGSEFPSYTIIEKGKADLVVSYHQNISPARAMELFKSKGIQVLSSVDEIRNVTVRIPFEKLNDLASLPFVYFIEPVSPPSKKDDTEGRSLHRSNFINSDYTTGRHYDGSGVVVGIADDGMVGPHIDFTGRITQHLTGLGGTHGDMTSGICAGAGNLDPAIRGMGTGADLHVWDISNYPHIVSAVSHYTNYGMVISSTSYSQGANAYNASSVLGDRLIHDNPQLQFVFSAGNDGTSDYGYGAGVNWGNITGGYKEGKNVITVGNLNNVDALETSSSRGPAPDGRIKPDICSNGFNQLSTDESNTFQVGGGTSAASPGVAGVLTQLYQAYKEQTGNTDAPSALIKAIVLNSAEDLGNPGPDFKHGWGRINAFRAVTTIEDHRYKTDSLGQGQTKTHNITVPSGVKQLRAMIYWSDQPGTAASAVNLVNDLNMIVTNPSSVDFNPWVLDPTPIAANLNTNAVRGIDSLNNAEQVTIDNPSSGTYTVTINGNQIPLGKQTYYLVYEFRKDSVYMTYPNGGEGFVPNKSEILRWDAFGSTGTFDLRYSTDNGNSWTVIQNGIAANRRYYSWNVPNNITDRALVEITRGSFSDECDTSFTIIGVPQNLHFNFACPDSVGLVWDSVAGATGYDVSMLGVKYMDKIGTTTNTSFTIASANAGQENWFSVKALGPNGGKGRRANAINKPYGTFDCILPTDGSVVKILHPAPLTTNCMNLSNFPVVIRVKNPGLNSISNIDLYYKLNNFTPVMETYTSPIAPGDSIEFTFTQGLTIGAPGIYNLKSWISFTGDQNTYNDSVAISFRIIAGTNGNLPIMETFETFTLCGTASNCEQQICNLSNGWINAQNGIVDVINWRVNEGKTLSASTGPDVDHTIGDSTGNYIYLEASSCFSSEAVLLSPCIDLSGIAIPFMTFWYHMFGAGMGELHVDVLGAYQDYNDIIPARSGDMGTNWRKDSVNLSMFAGQKIAFRFRGITGINALSDMALDDISVYDVSTGITENSGTGYFNVYPNPGNGIFNFTIGRSTGIKKLVVHDVVGKIVLEKTISGSSGADTGVIDLSHQAKGIYVVTVQSENFSGQVKLIKMN